MDLSSRAGMMISFNLAEAILVACRDISAGKSNQYIMLPYPIFTCKNHYSSGRISQEWYLSNLEHVETRLGIRRTPPYSLNIPHNSRVHTKHYPPKSQSAVALPTNTAPHPRYSLMVKVHRLHQPKPSQTQVPNQITRSFSTSGNCVHIKILHQLFTIHLPKAGFS